MKDFYDKMVAAERREGRARSVSKAYTTEYVCKGVGKELVK